MSQTTSLRASYSCTLKLHTGMFLLKVAIRSRTSDSFLSEVKMSTFENLLLKLCTIMLVWIAVLQKCLYCNFLLMTTCGHLSHMYSIFPPDVQCESNWYIMSVQLHDLHQGQFCCFNFDWTHSLLFTMYEHIIISQNLKSFIMHLNVICQIYVYCFYNVFHK